MRTASSQRVLFQISESCIFEKEHGFSRALVPHKMRALAPVTNHGSRGSKMIVPINTSGLGKVFPQGRHENSPPVHWRVCPRKILSPIGTAEDNHAIRPQILKRARLGGVPRMRSISGV